MKQHPAALVGAELAPRSQALGVASVYAPRAPTTGVLYAVVRAHLAAFLAEVDAREDPAVIRRILTHLGLPTDSGEPWPARAPPAAADWPA